MYTVEDCLLKAENYALAAQAAEPEAKRGFARLAAIWRNRALRVKLGQKFLFPEAPSDLRK